MDIFFCSLWLGQKKWMQLFLIIVSSYEMRGLSNWSVLWFFSQDELLFLQPFDHIYYVSGVMTHYISDIVEIYPLVSKKHLIFYSEHTVRTSTRGGGEERAKLTVVSKKLPHPSMPSNSCGARLKRLVFRLKVKVLWN